MIKTLPAMQETWVQSLGWEDPLEKEMAIHSSILAWKPPSTEEPGGTSAHRVTKRGFPGRSDSKESACNAGDLGSIPGL